MNIVMEAQTIGEHTATSVTPTCFEGHDPEGIDIAMGALLAAWYWAAKEECERRPSSILQHVVNYLPEPPKPKGTFFMDGTNN